MKSIILTAALIACSLNASAAKTDEVYSCDGQVVNVPSDSYGSFVLDMATIERTGKSYKLILRAEDGNTGEQTFVEKKSTPVTVGQITYHMVKSDSKDQVFDFVELEDNTALSYLTSKNGSGNQLQLQCKLK